MSSDRLAPGMRSAMRVLGGARLAIALLIVVVAAAPAAAQETPFANQPITDEQALQLTERFAFRVAQALQLEEERAAELRATLRESQGQRAEVARQRRQLMRELRGVVQQEQVDQERVAVLLDELLLLGVRLAEINVEEQNRLSAFMEPLERARFLYLRQRFTEQARQRLQQRRQDQIAPSRDNRRPPPAADQQSLPDPRSRPD